MRRSVIVAAALVLLLGVSVIACSDSTPPNKTISSNVDFRWDNFRRAEQKYPMPKQINFPMREALVKYTQRQDLTPHPWYIYVQIGEYQPTYLYYIGQTYPQSTCNFLSSTQDVQEFGKGDGRTNEMWLNLQAPSLDGIYYGSGSTSGGCDYFFFDMATDGMIVLSSNFKWFVSERVLGTLDARPVRVTN